jgi:hypothetical protein
MTWFYLKRPGRTRHASRGMPVSRVRVAQSGLSLPATGREQFSCMTVADERAQKSVTTFAHHADVVQDTVTSFVPALRYWKEIIQCGHCSRLTGVHCRIAEYRTSTHFLASKPRFFGDREFVTGLDRQLHGYADFADRELSGHFEMLPIIQEE